MAYPTSPLSLRIFPKDSGDDDSRGHAQATASIYTYHGTKHYGLTGELGGVGGWHLAFKGAKIQGKQLRGRDALLRVDGLPWFFGHFLLLFFLIFPDSCVQKEAFFLLLPCLLEFGSRWGFV